MSPDEVQRLPTCAAPDRTHRLIPSRFPPVQTFDNVASPQDLEAVLELEGWTNDRLVQTRLKRLPRADWVYGRPNASIVMAAFLHGSPTGLRFTGPHLGAWYAASGFTTALLEVVNGLRREIAQSALTEKAEEYREYTARLAGDFVDLRGGYPQYRDPDPASYTASQHFGESVRAGPRAGLAYDSVRDPAGTNWVSFRPRLILDILQARHCRATVRPSGKVIVEMLP